jgi:hypothetical protein
MMEFRAQNLDVPPGILPCGEGLLGHFPLLGRLPDGFLKHQAECEQTLI